MLLNSVTGSRGVLIRLIGLGLILWTIIASPFAPAASGRELVVLIVTAAGALAWLAWTFWSSTVHELTPDLYVIAAAGGFLALADNSGAGSAFAFVAAVSAAARAGLLRGMTVTALAAIAVGLAALLYDQSGLSALAYTLGFLAAGLGGSNIYQSRLREEQTELLQAQTQRSREEQLRSSQLEHQTRIARDIHDVLAHSLAGLTIQLEATNALLDQGASRELIRERIDAARQLAREGLQETSRAVGALRGETQGPGETRAPHTEQALRALTAAYQDADGNPAGLEVAGDLTAIGADAGDTVVRVVQEALTNVRKHAPGGAVSVRVDAGAADPGLLVAIIQNGRAAQPVPSSAPLAGSGGGYGLQGMRERAELCGGTLQAGASADGWRVELKVPTGERE